MHELNRFLFKMQVKYIPPYKLADPCTKIRSCTAALYKKIISNSDPAAAQILWGGRVAQVLCRRGGDLNCSFYINVSRI